MNRRPTIETLAVAVIAAMAAGSAVAARLDFPQVRAATDAEIKEYQSLGRVVTAPDGDFFLYEWSRPYNWAPDTKGIAPAATKRMQTWIYRVDTQISDATSRYLFHPGSGATYYLGNLSPDAKRVAVYELDRDDNSLKLGVVTFDDSVTPSITWFEQAPDSAKLELSPVWTSSDELVYPTKAGLMRAKVPPKVAPEDIPLNRLDWDKPVKATACTDCKPGMLESAAARREQVEKARIAAQPKAPEKAANDGWAAADKSADIPKDAKVLARAENGGLTVYAIDNPTILTLGFNAGSNGKLLFENERHPKPYVPPKAAQADSTKQSPAK